MISLFITLVPGISLSSLCKRTNSNRPQKQMQEICKALEGWVTHYPNFKAEVLMPGYNGWALPVGFKCQILPLCRNQISAKNLRLVSALNWFVLQKDSLHSNSLPRVWMFGVWVRDRASKDPLQISKGQITKCPSVCPSLLYLSMPRAVQLPASHLYSVLWFSTWVAIWGPGSSHLLWAAILCSRLHPLIQFINGEPTSCCSFYQTNSVGKRWEKVHHIILPHKGEVKIDAPSNPPLKAN